MLKVRRRAGRWMSLSDCCRRDVEGTPDGLAFSPSSTPHRRDALLTTSSPRPLVSCIDRAASWLANRPPVSNTSMRTTFGSVCTTSTRKLVFACQSALVASSLVTSRARSTSTSTFHSDNVSAANWRASRATVGSGLNQRETRLLLTMFGLFMFLLERTACLHRKGPTTFRSGPFGCQSELSPADKPAGLSDRTQRRLISHRRDCPGVQSSLLNRVLHVGDVVGSDLGVSHEVADGDHQHDHKADQCADGGVEAMVLTTDQPQAYSNRPRRVSPLNKVLTWAASLVLVGSAWAAALSCE